MKPFQAITLIILIIIFPSRLFCQDKIYLKNAAAINVRVLNVDSLTIIYSSGGDPDGPRYYLSRLAVDSIIYNEGRRIDGIEPAIPEYIKSNYAGAELFNLLSGKLNIEWERIMKKGSMSLSAGLLVNFGEKRAWSENIQFATYTPYIFHFRAGINFYPFNYSMIKSSPARFSTGFSVLAGAGRIWDESKFDLSYKAAPRASVMWNFRERFFIGKSAQAWLGGEISVLPVLTFLCPQGGLMIGFR